MTVRRALLVAVFAVGTLAVVAGSLWQALGPAGPAPASAPAATVPVARTAATVPERAAPERRVLTRWDARRASAWARGSVPDLRALYLPGSAAGRADVAALERYAARGLQVEGMRMQVLAWSVVATGPRRVVLRVTDRLVGGVAVRPDGTVLARLPVDRPSERTLALVSRGGRWVMATVR